jgi:hypothetical protein
VVAELTQIHDLTEEFKLHHIAWGSSGEAFRSQFSKQVRALQLGLYASVYANPSPHPIFDRNGPGKMFAKAEGNTLKYGKFEGGVAERHNINHVHLHRRSQGRELESGIFRDSLQLLLVLDLSNVRPIPAANAPKVFESYWNRSIRAFLERDGFTDGKQDGRSESRFLVGTPPTKAQLMPLLSELGDRIRAAAGTPGRWISLKQETLAPSSVR